VSGKCGDFALSEGGEMDYGAVLLSRLFIYGDGSRRKEAEGSDDPGAGALK